MNACLRSGFARQATPPSAAAARGGRTPRAGFAASAVGRWVKGQPLDVALLPEKERVVPGTCRWTYKTIMYHPSKWTPPPPFPLEPPLNPKRKYVLPPGAVVVESQYPFAGPSPVEHRVNPKTVVPTVGKLLTGRLAEAEQAQYWLFSLKNQERARPGDVVLVETWNSISAKLPNFQPLAPMEQPSVAGGLNTASVSRFGGVIIKVMHKGADTRFTVRNVIGGVGTNVLFPLFSPLIKSIRVVRRKVLRVPPKMLKKQVPKWKQEKARAVLYRSFNVRELFSAVKDKEPFWAISVDSEPRLSIENRL